MCKRAKNIPLPKLVLHGIILYQFKHDTCVCDTIELICGTFGLGTVLKSTCGYWYQHLESDNYSLKDQPRGRCPEELDDYALLQVIEADPMQTAHQLVVQFVISHITIMNHLHYVSKLGKWVPSESSIS